MTGAAVDRTRAPPSELAALSAILLDAVQILADAGEVDAACRIAGRACAALRRGSPQLERHYNALLHRLARRVPVGAEQA